MTPTVGLRFSQNLQMIDYGHQDLEGFKMSPCKKIKCPLSDKSKYNTFCDSCGHILNGKEKWDSEDIQIALNHNLITFHGPKSLRKRKGGDFSVEV